MKRFLLVAVLSILSLSAANAQGGNGYRNAIGIRGGYGAEVSYQRYIIPEGRIEASGCLIFQQVQPASGNGMQEQAWVWADGPMMTSNMDLLLEFWRR